MSDDGCVSVDNLKTCLTRGQSIGIALIAESGLISLTSLLVLLVLIIKNVYRNSRMSFEEKRRLVQEPTDILVISLFAADFLQGIGAALDIRWANTGAVHTGKFCAAQGAIQQLGEASVAMTTLAIALQTFVAVCFRKFVHDMKPAIAIVAFIWIYVILFVSIGASVNGASDYYVPTPYWCWIGENFAKERILGEYFWLWVTLFVSIFVYVPMFLWGNGNIKVDKTHWWKISLRLKPKAFSEEENARDRPPFMSLAILGYPVLYSIIVLPLSVTRWVSFSRTGTSSVPSAATFAATFLFGLSGAVNVILILSTRPNLLLFNCESEPSLAGDREMRTADLELTGGIATSMKRSGHWRSRRRRQLHENGRISTPSRSSSRDTTHAYAQSNGDEDLYDLYGVYPKYVAQSEHDLGSTSFGSDMLAIGHESSQPFRISDEMGPESSSSPVLLDMLHRGNAEYVDVDSLSPHRESTGSKEEHDSASSAVLPARELDEELYGESTRSKVHLRKERTDHDS
ncbi:hypothetical protein EW145_g1272 [Phellinidium pouzarii]|uniref:G-protein coupled receptors family 1 profile domain-containing protein n=1 Tax=Phellinidium pouzarii TaxID=167371 RepID=A0A4S4LF44_9AGAM|nr:hypothetical protein EW145_g1272 [Phellinidium pouzarii]